MEGFCLINKVKIHLIHRELGIRTGFPGKGKFPITATVQGHKGQRCEITAVNNDPVGIDTGLLYGFYQQPTEGIVSHLAKQITNACPSTTIASSTSR